MHFSRNSSHVKLGAIEISQPSALPTKAQHLGKTYRNKHRSDSNQGSDYTVIFCFFNSQFPRTKLQNLKSSFSGEWFFFLPNEHINVDFKPEEIRIHKKNSM